MDLNETNPSICNGGYDDIPSVTEYFKAIGTTYGIALASIGAICLVLSILIFIDTLRHALTNCSSRLKTPTIFVIAVYPIACLVSYLALLVPRSHLLAEALSQVVIMAAMYQLFCLFVGYCGGDSQLTKKVKVTTVTRLSLKVGPCCCLPCCSVLPTFKVNKKSLRCLKLLLLQMPLVQGLIYFIQLVLWAENKNLYQTTYTYIQPIIVVSVLSGIWGMLITLEFLKETVDADFRLKQKFGVLQLVIVFTKVQSLITNSLVWSDALPCIPPITPQVYANLIHYFLITIEMVLLALLARRLYKRELPDWRHRDSIISTVFGSTTGKIVGTDHSEAEGRNNLGFNL